MTELRQQGSARTPVNLDVYPHPNRRWYPSRTVWVKGEEVQLWASQERSRFDRTLVQQESK